MANQNFAKTAGFRSAGHKLVILQSIGIVVTKSKGTKVITYTCRYNSEHFIRNIRKCIGDHSCFLTYVTMVLIELILVCYNGSTEPLTLDH